MTEFERKMLALREREVKALEDNARRNGPDNYRIKEGWGMSARVRWKYGPPDHPEHYPYETYDS